MEGYASDLKSKNLLERTVFMREIMCSGADAAIDCMSAVTTITAAWLLDTGIY